MRMPGCSLFRHLNRRRAVGLWLRSCLLLACLSGVSISFADESTCDPADKPLLAGFATADITPDLETKKPVWMAGYGMGRRATGVHDPIMCRAMVLSHGDQKIAIVGLDLIGLQFPTVKRIRDELPEFAYVLVTSTHNHEGPDVIGIWGRGPFSRGVDDDYIDQIVERTVGACREALAGVTPVTAQFGTSDDASLLGDSRLPKVKDGILRVLRFNRAGSDRPAGILVQWNCHPEAMGPKNTLLTADFPAATVDALAKQYGCPVVYTSGALGGLMAPPDGIVKSKAGVELKEGDFEFNQKYGEAVAKLASSAIDRSAPIELRPFQIERKRVAVPVQNPLYRLARLLGVLKREVFLWKGNENELGELVNNDNLDKNLNKTTAVETEVACLELGDLRIGCLPGEVYPELVYGEFEEPAAAGVDFPDAPLEPSVKSILGDRPWMLMGLANDEVGYILPKRQWDKVAPYAYEKPDGQYGEINSCGPETAPILMRALQEVVAKLGPAEAE